MEKTPEEVKKGLELIANYCQTTEACEDACPYVNECDHGAKVENVPVAILDDVARLLYRLEVELESVKHERDELKCELSWINNPESMGK